MRTATQEAFFSIIRYEIAGTPLPEGFCVPDMDALVKLADEQDLTHLVYDALTKNGIPCTNEKALKQYCAALWRVEQIDHELQRISDVLEDNAIDFIPLKGSVMRGLYPERWMRTSADIDILFRKDQEKTAETILEKELGYEREADKVSSYHGSLHSPGNHVHVEPHWTLFYEDTNKVLISEHFGRIWDRAVPDPEGRGCRYALTDADLYAYHIAHLEKHFHLAGGCPVRGLIDLWLLDRMPGADIEGRKRDVEKIGLSRFEDKIKKLVYAWMDGTPAENEFLEQFALTGYMYGAQERRAMIGTQKKGSAAYILERLFMPYNQMKILYPVLKDHPWLLPFMWIRRLAKVTDKDTRKRLEGQMRASVTADRETLQDIRELTEYLGIDQ